MAENVDTSAEAGTVEPGISDDITELQQLKDEVLELKTYFKGMQDSATQDTEKHEKTPKNLQSDSGKKEKSIPDPIHIKYAESLKQQLGEYFDKDWDKQALVDRIKTMEIALSVASKKRSYRKESKTPRAEASDDNTSLYVGDFQNYKKLAQKLNKR